MDILRLNSGEHHSKKINDNINDSHHISWQDTQLVEHQKKLYNTIINTIVPPSQQQKIFGTGSNKLGLLIVEFREHEWLKGVLYNMAHVYGGQNVPLYIVHGNKNELFIKNILSDWKNVNYLHLDMDNIDIDDYSELLTKSSFWSYFETEYILIFQTDTFIRKTIPEHMFFFDYIGAPWNWSPGGTKRQVGNGGFSLRKVDVMKEIADKYTYNKDNDVAEDVFYSKNIEIDHIPPKFLASTFAVEHLYHDDPIGCHQLWRFIKFADIFKLMSGVAGVPALKYE